MPQTKSFATRILGITTVQILIVAPVVTLVNIDNKMAIVRLQHILCKRYYTVIFCISGNISNLDLWPIERVGAFCHQNEYSGYCSNQAECQNRCMQSPTCVGISCDDNGCRTCDDDESTKNPGGYTFFRRPGKSTFSAEFSEGYMQVINYFFFIGTPYYIIRIYKFHGRHTKVVC